MRDAARALDSVSDHLGEVLRHADELLAEWGRFGGQVRVQVEREAAAIGAVVDGAVERAASSGIDRAIADRLRALTVEIERIEQRARAAARVVTEQREADRRVLWIVVAGIVLANALLVALLLRKPEPVRVPEPIRMESPAAPAAPVVLEPARGITPASAGEPASAGSAAEVPAAPATVSSAPIGGPGFVAGPGSDAGSGSAATAGSHAAGMKPGAAPAGTKPGAATPASAASKSATGTTAKPGADAAGSARPTASPIALPPKATARGHKKLP